MFVHSNILVLYKTLRLYIIVERWLQVMVLNTDSHYCLGSYGYVYKYSDVA